MKPPTTYSEWTNYLDRLPEGSLSVDQLNLLNQGKIEWSKGSVERFMSKFSKAYENSLNVCSERLQKSLSRATNSELDIVKSLTVTRKKLEFLHLFATLNSIPGELQDYLKNMVESYAIQSQSSLEDSSKNDRSGYLKSLIKKNPLTSYCRESFDDQNKSEGKKGFAHYEDKNMSSRQSRKRRIIL